MCAVKIIKDSLLNNVSGDKMYINSIQNSKLIGCKSKNKLWHKVYIRKKCMFSYILI